MNAPGAQIQLNRIGDPAEADRLLDEMERATGLLGEPNATGRRYMLPGEDVSEAADRIAANLPAGWQDSLYLEL